MPQCRPRKRWFALISLFRHSLASLCLALLLSACSMAELERIATEGDQSTEAVSAVGIQATPTESLGKQPLLKPETEVRGGQMSVTGLGGAFRRLAAGAVADVVLVRPVAVAGVDDLLYILDADQKAVFVYDLETRLFTRVIEIALNLSGEPASLFVSKDHSFFVCDPLGKKVLQFSAEGTLLQTYQDASNLSRPISVLVDEISKNVYVADGSFSHVVVFNPFGKAIRAIGRRGSGPGYFRAITGMGVSQDGLVILDRLELPVQVFTWEGAFRYAFGEGEVTYPLAVAVDREQRFYVSDQIDNAIHVYQDARPLLTYGGSGSSPGRFRMATSLWVKGDRLYVADSLNRRVQILKINPQAEDAGMGLAP